jgi:hypothetical protein
MQHTCNYCWLATSCDAVQFSSSLQSQHASIVHTGLDTTLTLQHNWPAMPASTCFDDTGAHQATTRQQHAPQCSTVPGSKATWHVASNIALCVHEPVTTPTTGPMHPGPHVHTVESTQLWCVLKGCQHNANVQHPVPHAHPMLAVTPSNHQAAMQNPSPTCHTPAQTPPPPTPLANTLETHPPAARSSTNNYLLDHPLHNLARIRPFTAVLSRAGRARQA